MIDTKSKMLNHEPESEELVDMIVDMSFQDFPNDSIINGENLVCIIDSLIKNGLVKITFPKK